MSFIAIGLSIVFVFAGFFGAHSAHAAISGELGIGSTGGEVTELQQFLSTNALIYPERIVSGYFGPLTQAAVRQFQATYDIDQVGRVGPITRVRINEIMTSGFGLDTSNPIIANVSIQTGKNSATISWTTNELTRGQVYYDRFPIRSDESTRRGEQGFVGGTLVSSSGIQSSHTVTLSDLQSNSLYYYFIRSADNSGNFSVVLGRTFQTTQ